ncbi:hypothetical protein B0H12DRAFT_852057 [Mycena haematopus]|nr:hypothetical protein B0H12DRAFT_852057 [Mycena haematopus]
MVDWRDFCCWREVDSTMRANEISRTTAATAPATSPSASSTSHAASTRPPPPLCYSSDETSASTSLRDFSLDDAPPAHGAHPTTTSLLSDAPFRARKPVVLAAIADPQAALVAAVHALKSAEAAPLPAYESPNSPRSRPQSPRACLDPALRHDSRSCRRTVPFPPAPPLRPPFGLLSPPPLLSRSLVRSTLPRLLTGSMEELIDASATGGEPRATCGRGFVLRWSTRWMALGARRTPAYSPQV